MEWRAIFGQSVTRDGVEPNLAVAHQMAVVSQRCVLLLAGGDKWKQSTDIAKAIERLKDYKLRSSRP
jgi:hypothetical protein